MDLGSASMMKNKKLLEAGIIIALVFLVILSLQSYQFRSPNLVAMESKNPMLDQSPSLSPNAAAASSTTKPYGVNVTVLGTIGIYTVAPVCSLSNPPCAITSTEVYYVTVNGRGYRLVFPNATMVPQALVGSYVVVTGLFVTPSTYRADQYTPHLQFYGDIDVQVISYFHTLPH